MRSIALDPLLIPYYTWSMKRLVSTLSILLLGITLSASSALAQSQQPNSYETPPVLKASQILPPKLLKGPHFRVTERVTNDGYFSNYRIISDFGNLDVEGQQLLEIRVGEMAALSEMDKLSSSKVFTDAAVEAGKAAVVGPIKAVGKAVDTITDPDKLSDTVAGIPEGAEKLFSWAYRQAKGAASAVSDTVSPSDDKKESSGSGVTTSGTLKAGKKAGLEFIGYSKRERNLFRKFQINPYTSNQLIKDEIVRIAGIETAVGTAFKFVPSYTLIQGVGTFNTWYHRAEQLSLYEDPDEIKKKNAAELSALGIPEDVYKAFLDNPNYTPWTSRFITASLKNIGPKVPGHVYFIKAATQATNEPSTLYFVAIAEALEKMHKDRPLARIVGSLYLPSGVTKDGLLYVPLPVDYLFWTEEVAGILRDFKARVLKEEKFTKAEVRIRGRVSPLAKQNIIAMGATVTEGSL
jgi:hypothetical protein